MNRYTNQSLIAALALSVVVQLAKAAEPANPDPYANETPAQRDTRMQWWREARFGMMICWGVYAVPAGVYKDKRGGAEWIMNVAGIPKAEYQGFAKQFNPVKYDADAWVRIAKDAGMKYIVLITKHHDGFALFDSTASDWNVVKASPYGKDLLKPLAEACRKHGIKLGFYYSQAQDWCNKTTNMDDYLRDVAVPQVRELLTNYGSDTPAILWWDTPYDMTAKRGEPFLELLKIKPGILHNNRLVQPEVGGDFSTPEREIPATGLKGRDWETCMTMNDNWGYVSYDQNWKSTESLVRNLIDIASKGGNYLLNVGPTAEGEFPQASIERLQQMGKWLKVNGEAIHATQANPFEKLPFDGRCTRKPGKLFLHFFRRPTDGKITLPMSNKINRAYLLADRNTALKVEDKSIILPDVLPDPIATVVAIEIAGEPEVYELPTPPAAANALSRGKPATASSTWPQPGYEAGKAVDGETATRWGAAAEARSAWLEVDLGQPQRVGRAMICESEYPRTRKFAVEYLDDQTWKTLTNGTTIADTKVLDFMPVTARRFRLNILEATEVPTIAEFGVYAPAKAGR
jgi:alpha-L-fucosidase